MNYFLVRDDALPGNPPAWLLWSLPLAGVLSVVPLWWLWRSAYWGITGEDRVAEWLTFLAYLVICGLSAVIAVRLLQRGQPVDAALYALLAVGALFVAGEEVNWFQRQLEFAGPEAIVERNEQGVANVHNLLRPDALHATFVVVALYASLLARWFVPRLPVLRVRPWLYVPPNSLAMWFACTWIYFGLVYLERVLDLLFGSTVTIEDLAGPTLQEVTELALAGGFLLFVLRILNGGVDDGSSRHSR
ncbi:MAG: hypothetical protein ACRELC_02590, partial [Gemmatimonadota bacterium]